MVRIVIADDHAVVRRGICQVLALASDFEIVAEARDGWEVIEHLREAGVDLLILDMSMPGPHGIELLVRLRSEHPALPVLVLTMRGEVQVATLALKAGANGYLTKDCEPEVLIEAARRVAAGGRYIAPALAEKLVFESVVTDGDRPPHEILSNREHEVLVGIAMGRSLNHIAETLHVSAKTVSTHKARLMQKLGVRSTAELVRYAMKHGLEG